MFARASASVCALEDESLVVFVRSLSVSIIEDFVADGSVVEDVPVEPEVAEVLLLEEVEELLEVLDDDVEDVPGTIPH